MSTLSELRLPKSKSIGALLAAAALLLTGCSSASADLGPENAAITQVIDVRTPEEFAESHVDGAININVESADFGAAIAALDPSATYLVYCRTGRRSAIAAQEMSDTGLTVLDGGGLDAMANRGWAFVS